MGQKPSKGKLLFDQVRNGNVEGIRALHRDGANLEWKDKEGKTPLTLACLNRNLYDVAILLIELGSDVNPPHPTPLRYAALNGLDNSVKLLLSHGAKDWYQTLGVARVYGLSSIVRTIESHVCLFSGWMREFYVPPSLDLYAPQLLSRRVWVVIVPDPGYFPDCTILTVYASLENAQPRTQLELCVQRLNVWQSSTSVTFLEAHLQLAPATEGDSQQLKWFCDAFKGIQQPMQPPAILQTAPSSPSAPPLTDNIIAAMDQEPIHHPLINSTPPVDVPSPSSLDDGSFRKCVICLDAPSEGACVPCGHISGCMPCLNNIKSKNWGCPVCRANIDQVMKVYHACLNLKGTTS